MTPANGAILQARGLSSGYGQVPVVSDLDLEVHPGEVVALLGPNGAGKTTSLLTLAGELPVKAGTIYFLGKPERAPLHSRSRRGLAYVTEERSVFTRLTVAENLKVAYADKKIAFALFPELEPLASRRGGQLSGGEQQMLALARALAREPRLLMADELSLGLAPLVVDRLLEAVRVAATEKGVGVLLVEQHVRKVMTYADRAYILQRGRVVLSGTATEMASRISEIEAFYLPDVKEAHAERATAAPDDRHRQPRGAAPDG